MARGQYTETVEIRALRKLIAFAEDPTVTPERLARAGKAYLLPAVREAFQALSPHEAEAVRQDLRALFDTMAQKAEPAPPDEHRFTVTLTAASSGQGVVLFVEGAPRDVLLYQACTFLDRTGTDRLHRCPAPDCRRLFVKTGRREYCSSTCQRRVYLANYDPFAAKPRRTTTPKATPKTKQQGRRHGTTTRKR